MGATLTYPKLNTLAGGGEGAYPKRVCTTDESVMAREMLARKLEEDRDSDEHFELEMALIVAEQELRKTEQQAH